LHDIQVALIRKPPIQLVAGNPNAAADPHGRNLTFRDQLVRPAASDPQDLRDFWDLQVFVL